MKTKTKYICFSIFLLAVIFLNIGISKAMVLPVPAIEQEQSNWCWAASAQAVITYFGNSTTQCYLATILRTAQWGYADCCIAPLTDNYCNQTNYLYNWAGSVNDIMAQYGISNTFSFGSLTLDGVKQGIYAGKPFIMAWLLSNGNGHALVGRGVYNDTIFYVDPWYGVGYRADSYNYVVSSADHSWEETLQPNNTPTPPNTDLKANGYDNLQVNSFTPVNVRFTLNPNRYMNMESDLWIAAYYQGTYYFLNSSGQWTTQWIPYAGALTLYSNVSIFNGTIPSGTAITFYVVMDLTKDGIYNATTTGAPYYYDMLTITSY